MEIKIIQTGDIHGCFFPYDFLTRKEATASLSQISSYIKEQREIFRHSLLLLDLGDIMQGQPTCYQSPRMSKDTTNLSAELLNRLRYDAICIGNHDIETGHDIFDKWRLETNADVLAANAIRVSDGKPYFKPYKKVEIGDVKIVVLGILTNAIPYWLSRRLWKGMRFENPVDSASKWMNIIKRDEKPDIIIGLFHTGWEGGINDGKFIENATRQISEEIEGFDVILFGHDHIARCQTIRNKFGNDILCMNASSNAEYINDITIEIRKSGKTTMSAGTDITHKSLTNRLSKEIIGRQIKVSDLPLDTELVTQYQSEIMKARQFCENKIGETDIELRTRDCYFGDSPMAALIHNIQLEVTGAQISFTAPLAYDETINKGAVTVADIFNIYKYENTIVALKMKGSEIKKYLEYSYSLWVKKMEKSSDKLMNVSEYQVNEKHCCFFKNLTFNFDTAYGINYTVDVRKEPGNMVTVTKLSNGEEFNENAVYSVAMHSYRANGGNEFLTKGVGIPHSELSQRILFESDKDERDYIIGKFIREKNISPIPANNWTFVPDEWTSEAIKKERKELFDE